jgi:hypothetical protein
VHGGNSGSRGRLFDARWRLVHDQTQGVAGNILPPKRKQHLSHFLCLLLPFLNNHKLVSVQFPNMLEGKSVELTIGINDLEGVDVVAVETSFGRVCVGWEVKVVHSHFGIVHVFVPSCLKWIQFNINQICPLTSCEL